MSSRAIHSDFHFFDALLDTRYEILQEFEENALDDVLMELPYQPATQ
jgi:hypothetical protein